MAEHSLPERPDLEQLRRQAKELRRAARAGEPDAIERIRQTADVDPAAVSLSQSQLVIAREHGFRSWPQLKDEVEDRTRDIAGRGPARALPPKAVAAGDLMDGQLLVLDGRVVEVDIDPDDRERIQLAITVEVGPPPGDHPDRRLLLLSCPSDTGFHRARKLAPGERPRGPAMHVGAHVLEFEGSIAANELQPGQVIVTDGQVVSHGPDRENPATARFVLSDHDWREISVVCPADMRLLPTVRRIGGKLLARSGRALPAESLEPGQIVMFTGQVIERDDDPDDRGRVRIVLVKSARPPWSDNGDKREIVINCPADMRFDTAQLDDVRLTVPTAR